jgi:hypothetical protein
LGSDGDVLGDHVSKEKAGAIYEKVPFSGKPLKGKEA